LSPVRRQRNPIDHGVVQPGIPFTGILCSLVLFFGNEA
jgi:hypothetical protein